MVALEGRRFVVGSKISKDRPTASNTVANTVRFGFVLIPVSSVVIWFDLASVRIRSRVIAFRHAWRREALKMYWAHQAISLCVRLKSKPTVVVPASHKLWTGVKRREERDRGF